MKFLHYAQSFLTKKIQLKNIIKKPTNITLKLLMKMKTFKRDSENIN